MIQAHKSFPLSSAQLADFFGQLPSRRNVLRAIYNSGGISRAEIARETGLTKVTVSEIVSQMLELGLLSESEPQRVATPGKPPVLVTLRRDSLRTIAVDLSSSDSMVIGSVDLYGQLLSRREINSSFKGVSELIESLNFEIRQEIESSDLGVVGIGVGIAGVVDDRGKVIDGAALNLHQIDLQSLIKQEFGIEVTVANDANVAAQADLIFGGASGNFLLIRIERGLGAGLMLDGRPFLGSSFAAGELGHVVVSAGGAPCACGNNGCLEAEVSSLLNGGTAAAKNVGRLVGSAIAPIVSVLNLHEIVLAAPLQIAEPELLSQLKQQIEVSTLPEISQGLNIRFSKLGKDVVLLGAAATALSTVLGVA